MTLLRWAGAIALALCSCAPSAALAQQTGQIANLPPRVGATGLAFGQEGAPATTVSKATPLPAELTVTSATSACLTGTSTGAGFVGPWAPQLGRPIIVELSGTTWPGGTAQLFRSTDGGATKLPLRPADVVMGTMTGFGVDMPWSEYAAGATFYEYLPGAGITYKVCN